MTSRSDEAVTVGAFALRLVLGGGIVGRLNVTTSEVVFRSSRVFLWLCELLDVTIACSDVQAVESEYGLLNNRLVVTTRAGHVERFVMTRADVKRSVNAIREMLDCRESSLGV